MKSFVMFSSVLAGILVACSGANPQQVLEPPMQASTVYNPPDASVPDATVDAPAVCIAETNTEFCSRLGANCNVFDTADNCGMTRQVVNCGMCANQSGCVSGRCAGCTSPTNEELCAAAMATCGSLPAASDSCGINRTPNCGTCATGSTCTNNKCVINCVPETNLAFCTRNKANCGTITANDNCMVSRTVQSCGSLRFSGGAGIDIAGGVPLEVVGTYHIEAWVNPSNALGGGIVFLGAPPTLLANSVRFELGVGNSLLPQGTPAITIPANKWTFIFAGGSGGSGYVGTIVDNVITRQVSKIDVAYGNIMAGIASTLGQGYTGQMNNVRIWSIARTDVDMLVNYHDCLSIPQPGLVRQWCMPEGSGTNTADGITGVTSLLNTASWDTGTCQ